MIGRLAGVVVDRHPPEITLDVQGVGYEVSVPLSVLASLPNSEKSVVLYTHLAVREDAHQLYGFSSRSDRDLFRQLIKVNGVGPKLALAILSGMSSDELSLAIDQEDISALTRLPGVGKKTAERLLVDLRDRLSQWRKLAPLSSSHEAGPLFNADASVEYEATAALEALGYKNQQASKMVKAVIAPNLATAEVIRLALKQAV